MAAQAPDIDTQSKVSDKDSVNVSSDNPQPPLNTVKRYIFPDYDNFDLEVLPEHWVKIRHVTGIVIYVHQPTRVITLSRPYSVGNGNLRHHKIPVFSIPCLAYRKRREQESVVSCLQNSTPTSKVQPNHRTAAKKEISWSESSPTLEAVTFETILTSNSPQTDHSLNDEALKETSDNSVSADEDVKDKRATTELIDGDDDGKEEGELTSDEDGEDATEISPEPPKKRAFLDSPSLSPEKDASKELRRSLPENQSKSTPSSSILPSSCSSSNCKEVSQNSSVPIVSLEGIKTQVVSVGEHENSILLSPEAVRDYCSRLFELKEENAFVFRNRGEHSRFLKSRKKSNRQNPSMLMMPEQANLIRYQIPPVEGCPAWRQQKEGTINPVGKSAVCILHEYCQNVMRKPPTYKTSVQESEKLPYRVTVIINDANFAFGSGTSKKQARVEAARNALEKLIPEYKKVIDSSTSKEARSLYSEKDLETFSSISVTDRRLYNITTRMGSLSPYAVLTECLNRSCIPENDIRSSMKSLGRNRHFFELSVGENSVKVQCKNKREGRHLAAQELLAILHPNLKTWSEFLALYGPGSKPDKRCDSEAILDAQTRSPSTVKTSLIRLLKMKMLELADQWDSNEKLGYKGKFNVSPFNLPVVTFHPDSSTTLYGPSAVDTEESASVSSSGPRVGVE